MRLLKDQGYGDLRLVEVYDNNVPRYAILSHTWGPDDEEVNFKDLMEGTGKHKTGYKKIQFCRKQAAADGLQHFWVDTCCIDKSSSTELTEAINSMFRWYKNAAECYVYLSDVSKPEHAADIQPSPAIWKDALHSSRWFSRGWTLQELVAPDSVRFFSREGNQLGSKNTLEQPIHEITGIPIKALRGAPLADFQVEERMSWAEHRETKRQEDKAYSLFSIFDIHMPLLYGEGREKAFVRLREEIDKTSKRKRDTYLEIAQDRPHTAQGRHKVRRVHETKIDLANLPYVAGAIFNSYQDAHETCHPNTRVDLLQQIRDWAQQTYSKSIFWLNGGAGTGKSTISRTFAGWLTDQGRVQAIDLGASFFFKRGEGNRDSAIKFFPTLVRQLMLKIPDLNVLIAEVIDSDPLLCDKSLGEQFDKLIYTPLKHLNLTSNSSSTLVVVVDALDECEKEEDIKAILQLWSRLPQITTVDIRLFLTSRPELPIRLGFKDMSANVHQDMLLRDVPQNTVQQDILVFLKDEFSKIRRSYNAELPSGTPLYDDWPGDTVLQTLAERAVPLFIVGATICRFVGNPLEDATDQLERLLRFQGTGQMSQMEQTYLPVLKQLSRTSNDSTGQERLYTEFRMIVGSIIILASPLSTSSLAVLLDIRPKTITARLRSLHSVLHVPVNPDQSIRTLYLSFGEFLLDNKFHNEPFGVDGPATHQMLLSRCLHYCQVLTVCERTCVA